VSDSASPLEREGRVEPVPRGSNRSVATDPGSRTRTDCTQAAAVCACFHLRRSARAVTRYFDEALAESGLRSTQFLALVVLGRDGPAPMREVARTLGLDRSALTRNLAPLRRRGLVSARTLGRGLELALTARGEDLLEAAIPAWRRAQEGFVSVLGAGRWTQMLGDLQAAVRATERG
jgi:DNA-binding MarR family transcriptional regulator